MIAYAQSNINGIIDNNETNNKIMIVVDINCIWNFKEFPVWTHPNLP